MFDGLLNRALDDDDSTLGVIFTDDLPSRPTGYPSTPTFPTQQGGYQSVPRFDQITALINKGLDVVSLFKTQNSIAQQQQIQSQQYRENPSSSSSFGGGLDSAVNWIQNNLGTVAIIGVVWYALNMNPPSRRR